MAPSLLRRSVRIRTQSRPVEREISDLQPKLPGTVAENRNNEWPTAPQNGWGGWLFSLMQKP